MDNFKLTESEEKNSQPFSYGFYAAVALIFFVMAFASVELFKSDVAPSFHAEIFPTDAISFIKDDAPIRLADGDYELAMPAQGTLVKGIAPMMLVEVDGELYPLNIADDSVLPRQGKVLPARILFGFTSPHAENKLTYDEKHGEDPVESYSKKARYYLHVENGFGQVQRRYIVQK